MDCSRTAPWRSIAKGICTGLLNWVVLTCRTRKGLHSRSSLETLFYTLYTVKASVGVATPHDGYIISGEIATASVTKGTLWQACLSSVDCPAASGAFSTTSPYL